MTSLAVGAALLLASASVSALAQSNGAVQPSAPPAPQQGTTGAAAPNTMQTGSPEATKPVGTTAGAALNATDKLFVRRATLGGMAEVEEGKLAATQAQSAEVKTFGQHMVDDHTTAGDKLKSIAAAEGAEAPAALTPAETKQVASLQKLKGAAFDRRYVKGQVKAHQDTIALFRKEASSGGDPQLKQFASATLPTLLDHLKEAQTLQK